MRPGHLSRIRRCSFGLMMVHQLLAQPDACHRIRHPVIGTDILANLFVELGCRRLLADPDMYTELHRGLMCVRSLDAILAEIT